MRQDVITHVPQPRGDILWTAGVWDDGAGHQMLLLTGHC